jgi:hypothetical protein
MHLKITIGPVSCQGVFHGFFAGFFPLVGYSTHQMDDRKTFPHLFR